MAEDEEETLTNLTPVEQPSAAPDATAPAAQTTVIASAPQTDWGPPSAARYFAALLIVLAVSAAGGFVVWYFWGAKIWNTITGDWT